MYLTPLIFEKSCMHTHDLCAMLIGLSGIILPYLFFALPQVYYVYTETGFCKEILMSSYN